MIGVFCYPVISGCKVDKLVGFYFDALIFIGVK